MKSLEKYYKEKLYPLQDGVMRIVKDLGLPFYLTGGTALSRFYFNHRYSDDLDLFVNNDPNFREYMRTFVRYFQKHAEEARLKLITERINIFDNYAQFFLEQDNTELKIDFVNDLALRFDDLVIDQHFGKVDSLRNILSNKISALYRFEIKDYIDVWWIAKSLRFSWRQLMLEAKQKEASVDPIEINNLFRSFPFESLDLIKWITPVDYGQIRHDFKVIAEDILDGCDNSLV